MVAVPGRCAQWARRLEGIIDEGTATKAGGAKAHWPNIGWHVPTRGPDCGTWRERAHLRFGQRTGRRVFEQSRTMVPRHPCCEGRPERFSRADDNQLMRVLPRRFRKQRKSSLRLGFLVKGPLCMAPFFEINLRAFSSKKLGVARLHDAPTYCKPQSLGGAKDIRHLAFLPVGRSSNQKTEGAAGARPALHQRVTS